MYKRTLSIAFDMIKLIPILYDRLGHVNNNYYYWVLDSGISWDSEINRRHVLYEYDVFERD